MSIAQERVDRYAGSADALLRQFHHLSELVGSSLLPNSRSRNPGDGVHPLLHLLGVAPHDTERGELVEHLDAVVERWKNSPTFSTALLRRRVQPRLLRSRIEGVIEWRSLLNELRLRDCLESRGVVATLTTSGPDIKIERGSDSAWLEVYNPMRSATEGYISALLELCIDPSRPCLINWSFQEPEPPGVGSGDESQLIGKIEDVMRGMLPYTGTIQLSGRATLCLDISEHSSIHVVKDEDSAGTSLTGLQDWLAGHITSKYSSMKNKFAQLSAASPSILVIDPSSSTGMTNQLSALVLGHPDPWGAFHWPADLPPQCVGILLWWYRLGTSEPWHAHLLVPRSAPSLPLWLQDALDTTVIQVADAQSSGGSPL